jgi:hypothetical protein
MKQIRIPSQNWDLKDKNFDILLDIVAEPGSKIQFKSRDLDFIEFPILERFRPFPNRKFGI